MRQKVASYVADDGYGVEIGKLSLTDQFILLIRRLLYDESESLKTMSEVDKAELELKADLMKFIEKAIDPIRKGKKKSVTMSLTSKWRKYIYELPQSRWARSYDIEIMEPEVEYDIHYYILVRMTVKEALG